MNSLEPFESNHPQGRHLLFLDKEHQETFEGYLKDKDFNAAILLLQEEISTNPLDAGLFNVLGDVYEKAGMLGESIVAYDRALHLREIAGRYEPTPIAWHIKDLNRYSEKPEVALNLDGLVFPRLIFSGEGNKRKLVGRSLDGEHFLKFNLKTSESEKKRWYHEIDILERLQKNGCHTAPGISAHGSVQTAEVKFALDPEFTDEIQHFPETTHLDYAITDFLRKDPTPSYGDIALAILEHKHCGVYIGKVRESSLRFNAEAGICYLVGFKDAVVLDENEKNLLPRPFFEWAMQFEKDLIAKKNQRSRSLLFGNWKPGYPFWGIFRDTALNLSATTSFRDQSTTQHELKVYHSFTTDSLCIDGAVEFDTEIGDLLDKAFAKHNKEQVLDVGCAGALYTHFLASKGHEVTGIDIDNQLMNGCNVLARISGVPMKFQRLNLDYENLEKHFDTACMFNVLSYAKDPLVVVNKLLDNIRRRFLLVMALDEKGHRNKGKHIVPTEGWKFETLKDLQSWLEKLFTGFEIASQPFHLSGGKYFIELMRRESEDG